MGIQFSSPESLIRSHTQGINSAAHASHLFHSLDWTLLKTKKKKGKLAKQKKKEEAAERRKEAIGRKCTAQCFATVFQKPPPRQATVSFPLAQGDTLASALELAIVEELNKKPENDLNTLVCLQ